MKLWVPGIHASRTNYTPCLSSAAALVREKLGPIELNPGIHQKEALAHSSIDLGSSIVIS
jgi:hypothetical protein